MKDKLIRWLTSPGVLRPIFTLLRRWFPILVLGKRVVVSRHADVIEVLTRDTDFTIAEINEALINENTGPFILGWDRSPRYDTEAATLREAVRKDDLESIRSLVKENATELVDAVRPSGEIDMVNGLARVVAVRTVASYFGIPTPGDPMIMMRWMRDIFHAIFANPTNDANVHSNALRASEELGQHMDRVIAARKSHLHEPDQPDDFLGRLLLLQNAEHAWLDDSSVRRNIAGVILGAVDTTSKFTTLAMDELLRRPDALAGARAAAMAGNMQLVRNYLYEAVRFNPDHPAQARFCKHETELAAGTPRARKIPAGTFVFPVVLSAMFDPDVFIEPKMFRADRQTEYLHFGYGMHQCFGTAINGVQIPEIAASLLRLPNLRRAPGSAGRIAYDGPFPDRLVLEFDHD